MLDHHCYECRYRKYGSAHNSKCTHDRMGEWVCFEEGIDEELCCDYFEALPTAEDKSIKLPKEAVENIVECISNQRDIPVEFKAVLVNNFWDLL